MDDYIRKYNANPMKQKLLEKLTATSLLMKFLAFYGTRMFVTMCTRAHILSLINPSHILHTC
jgi:hypothetical protein